jgi:hypothetical protein
MTILIENICFKKLDNGTYRVSGIVDPPDAPNFCFIGVTNEDCEFTNDDDLQIIGFNTDFFYHAIDEVRNEIKRAVFLKRLQVLLEVDQDRKEA